MTFDEWAKEYGSMDPYGWDAAEYAWNAALEAAAVECELLNQHSFGITPDQCADSIRAIKKTNPQEKK